MTFPRPGKPDPKQRLEAAAAMAVTALGFIAGDGERLGRFLLDSAPPPRHPLRELVDRVAAIRF